jgi:hypothetical protein
MYGRRQPVTSARGQLSAGEQELLAKAGASNSNNMIRQKLAADNRAMQAADQSFTNKILFGMIGPNMNGTPVNANAAAKGLPSGHAVGRARKPSIKKDSSDGGWFDWIF